jgi:hypothetical protein
MKFPDIVHAEQLASNNVQTQIDGKWVPARALGYMSLWHRFYCAWLVWTGKADALVWPGGQ